MKIADPSKPFVPRTGPALKPSRGNIPYYTESCGASLWTSIAKWKESGYKRTAWALEPYEKENTLRARLFNALRWLNDHGTDEQRTLCAGLTFTKIGKEFVLTVRRAPVERLAQSSVGNGNTPRAQSKHEKSFEQLKNDVIHYITTTVASDSNAAREGYEAAVSITAEQKDELTEILEGAGNCAYAIRAGHAGSVRVLVLSESELEGLKKLQQPTPK